MSVVASQTLVPAATGPPSERQVVVTVNGPGEISAWLQPFAVRLKERAPQVRLAAALLPCVFATGCEARVLAKIREVDAFATPCESMRCILRGRRPAALADLPGSLLHFGGEPLLGLGLAWRLKYPPLAYAEGPFSLQSRFSRVYYTDAQPTTAPAAPVLGNMMVDAARMRCPKREAGRGQTVIGIFTGSRDYMVKNMLPFFTKVAGDVAETAPDVRWLVGKADYVSTEMLVRCAREEDGRKIEGDSAAWDGHGTLTSTRGVRLEVVCPAQVMTEADLVITIPGTNTAELSALGVPMIVVVTTYYPEVHPLPGLLGHLDHVPLFGKYIKRAGALAYHSRVKFLAHPNRKRGRAVVPEVTGRITTGDVAAAVRETLAGPLEPMRRELLSIMGPPGATERLVDEVLACLPAPGRM